MQLFRLPLLILSALRLVTSTKLSPEPGGLCTSSVFKCDIRSEARRLTCAGTLHGIYAFQYGSHDSIRFLSLCKWYYRYFDPDLLRLYPKIEKFTLSRSVITHLVADFPLLPKLKVIVMANLGLEVLDSTAFSNVDHLRVLDLRANSFLTLSAGLLQHLPELHQVYLAGKEYMCKDELIWMCEDNKPGTLVLDKEEMYCGWKYPGLRVEPVMKILKKMNAQCPSAAPHNCMCMLDNAVETLPPISIEALGESMGGANVVGGAMIKEMGGINILERINAMAGGGGTNGGGTNEMGGINLLERINAMGGGDVANEMSGDSSELSRQNSLIPIITVDCSYRKLIRLPEYLPDNTTTVLAQGNQISDISGLNSNSHYSHVLDLILDFNPIKSLNRLEGATWLQNIRNLSLRGNKLSQIPTYILDNALERNTNINLICLGDNPWRCDCRFTPGFQDFIIKYERVIQDPMGIRCAAGADATISQQPIRTLPKSLICTSDQSNIEPLLILNIALLTSIIFIVLKFCYDYIMYKKFGQLPWIITIVP